MVDHTRESLASVLASEYPGRLDVVYDGVGGRLLADIMPHLAPGSRTLVVGYISGYPHNAADARDASTALSEGLFWAGSSLEVEGGRRLIGGIWPSRSAVLAAKRLMFAELGAGTLTVRVDESASFQGLGSVTAAVEHMLGRTSVGKVCVQIAD